MESHEELNDRPATDALVGTLKNFTAGGVGGVCMVLVGHPFDTIKVHHDCAPLNQTVLLNFIHRPILLNYC